MGLFAAEKPLTKHAAPTEWPVTLGGHDDLGDLLDDDDQSLDDAIAHLGLLIAGGAIGSMLTLLAVQLGWLG